VAALRIDLPHHKRFPRRFISAIAHLFSYKDLFMTAPILDVVAIGNAMVDVIAQADEAFLVQEALDKGSMRLIDAARAIDLYSKMGPGIEASGGSAANTAAGMASLGRKCGFIGQVAADQLGAVYTHDIRSIGVTFTTAPMRGNEPTGRCLILVTPDGQRTMNTSLGVANYLLETAIDRALIESAAVLYLEGYLWDLPESRASMRAAIGIAKAAGRKVAFTLSDAFCIERHRGDFNALVDNGELDILFCNESEILSLVQTDDVDAAIAAVAPKVPMLVVTRSEHGAIAVSGGVQTSVPAASVATVVDTTGAGDLFAAGFLAGQAEGRSVHDSLTMGAICAAEVISHFGPRPETDLKALVAAQLG
jgi:sugar/nucleoside kinase (ribokinase family)